MYWFDIPDELLPPVYRNIQDMYAYARTLDTELREFLVYEGEVLDNFFIQTCDEETLQAWENLLGIASYVGESIEDRRRFVLAYLNNQYPITEPYIRKTMADLFGADGYTLDVSKSDQFEVSYIIINAPTDKIKKFSVWFAKMCPAHIKWGAVHTETSEAINEIPANTTGHFGVSSSCTMAMGSETLYLGENSYSINWVEL